MLSGELLIALVAAANVALLSAQNGISLSPANVGGLSRASVSGCCQCEDAITNEEAGVITIRVLSAGGETFRHIYEMIETGAREFEVEMDGRVSIVVEEVANLNQLADEIRNNAILDVAYFDGFVSNPGVVGSAVTRGGFMDLSEFVRESLDLDWLDILPAFRDSVLVYDGKPYMFPLDGDVHSLFYRRDVLEHFNLSVPRTWDEYVEVAKSTHGQTFNGTRLDGSCVGRAKHSVGQYYANLVLSSHSQALGTKSGFLFDVQDMTPLAGEALAETIRQLEEQNRYGSEDELETIGGGEDVSQNIKRFIADGACVLTYNWGDNFKRHLSSDSKVMSVVGVAPTPGSTKILDRSTGKLVPCTAEICPYGEDHPDIGRVNRAPYAAFGGWAAAVANNDSPLRQRSTSDFFAFVSSSRESRLGVIPNATGMLFNGQDPFRSSHLIVEEWMDQGYTQEGVESYLDTILTSLSSKNLALDIRFPQEDKIMDVLDAKIHDHLKRVRSNKIAEADRERERLAVANAISDEWESIIKNYDNDGRGVEPGILELYQKSLNIYKPPHDYNYIGNMRYYGWTIASIAVVLSLVMGIWVLKNRSNRIVRASQPIFLGLICLGSFLMAAGIYPLNIDDENTSDRGCSIACMATPWFIGCGFSVSFSSLLAKTIRINRLFGAATKFARITVTVKDVMKPFVAFTSVNVVLLLIWTLVNPLVFVRHEISITSSFGICEPKYKSGVRLIPIVLFGVLNCCTLVVANIQAYRARRISDEYSESKFVFISLVSILQAVVLGAPVAFITVEHPRIFTCVVSSFVFIITTTLLLLIFVPKILLLRKKIKEKKAQEEKRTATTGDGAGAAATTRSKDSNAMGYAVGFRANFSSEVSRVVCSLLCASTALDLTFFSFFRFCLIRTKIKNWNI